MALTEQQIFEAIAPFYAEHHVARSAAEMCMDEYRAIEAAATAPLLESIAALTAQVEQATEQQALLRKALLETGAFKSAPIMGQVEQAAQPVAIRYRFHYPDDGSTPYRVGDWRYTQGPWEPVPDTARDVLALYTAPPKAAPLTDDERADMFWDSDDTERQHGSIGEFLNEEICNGSVEVGAEFTMWRAERLSNVRIRVTSIDDEECEAEWEVIGTPATVEKGET